MSADQFDPVTRDRTRNVEMRAAVDVMFEALSHIQASLETKSEEKRVQSYRKFKEALYDRFEYLVEERQDRPGEPGAAPQNGAAQQNGAALEADGEAEKDDTLEKLWPAIAKERQSE